ncbi:MAG: aldehyde ferredoxin oxidoreductase C-terminal domain-containing protein [Bacillota bacterium]
MNIVRVNMTTGQITREDVPPEYRALGGRGLTSKLLSDEVNPRCHALGMDNKIIIAPGLLTGTVAPCSGRTSLGAKSPLTGTIKESNVGGAAGQYLAAHGIKSLILEGRPAEKHLRVLVVEKNEIRLEVKDNLAGMGNYQTVDALKMEYGPNCAVISIGPAGEMGAAVATVAVSDMEGRPTRHAGRGGIGAVMGSKGIKAIVVSRPEKLVVEASDNTCFREKSAEFAKSLQQSKKTLTDYGTAVLVNIINEFGGLPTRNFSAGRNGNANDISGEKLHQLCRERGGVTGHPCSRGCAIKCSNIFVDKLGNYITSGLEYETIALLGSNCGLNDLDAIAKLDRLCDDLGIDTMEMGVTLGVAMESEIISYGDYHAMYELISGIAKGTGFGKILGQGAVVTGRILGVERVPAVKGQGISAYDPRALKGTGVTYATSTMGADHTAGNCLPGRGGLNCHEAAGQVNLSRELQIYSMVCDILGICIFVGPLAENMPVMAALAEAFMGKEFSPDILKRTALETLRVEVRFNRKAGIGSGLNDLPHYFRTEPLPENGLVFDVPAGELERFDF